MYIYVNNTRLKQMYYGILIVKTIYKKEKKYEDKN